MPNFPGVTPPTQPNAIQVGNSRDPTEAPICLPYHFDWTAASTYNVDLTMVFQSGIISNIQTLYCDNSANNEPMILEIMGTQQSIAVPSNSQAYLPILVSQPGQMSFSSQGGTGVTGVELLNVPMPAIVWAVTT